LRRIHFGILQRGAREVVDADLSDYFNTIPHGDLMGCVSRRISDGTVPSIIRHWLNCPVVQRQGAKLFRSTVARDTHRGTPQGGSSLPCFQICTFAALCWLGMDWATRRQRNLRW
jgi:hypothetical protein